MKLVFSTVLVCAAIVLVRLAMSFEDQRILMNKERRWFLMRDERDLDIDYL